MVLVFLNKVSTKKMSNYFTFARIYHTPKAQPRFAPKKSFRSARRNSTFFILIDFSIMHFDKMSTVLPILYFKGSQVEIFKL